MPHHKFPKVFVKPGEGRRVPLPLPGRLGSVPAAGRMVAKDFAIQRLIRNGDLVVGAPPAAAPETPAPAPAPAAEAAAATQKVKG
jgi:hypothetical protein